MTEVKPEKIERILAVLRDLLADPARTGGVELRIVEDGVIQREGWISVIVDAADADIEAYDYVRQLQRIEQELRERTGYEQVLVVPGIGD